MEAETDSKRSWPYYLGVVRPANIAGVVSGAIRLAWLIIATLASRTLSAAAFGVGVAVGVSQGLFMTALESPYLSPKSKAESPPAQVRLIVSPEEVLPLAPQRLFVEPYDGEIEEQRGTEALDSADLVGSLGVASSPALPHTATDDTLPSGSGAATKQLSFASQRNSCDDEQATAPSSLFISSAPEKPEQDGPLPSAPAL